MVKLKATSRKQQKRGIDFKKIKRKVGRKLPPPKNFTNTQIKSKAIVLPEQSIASDKAGLPVSKKGLTLKELLQQTSHHNPKVRRDALIGIRDIFLKYPNELKLHKLAVIEKLRERMSDDDKLNRETLYQLLKSVIFPGCKEDNQGPFVSLIMTYIFNAMTHLAIDIRLMAFKFFDLCAQFYPSSFLLYSGKILQNYEDILRKNQFYLQDKGELNSSLSGLARCLSLLSSSKRKADLACENELSDQGILHAFEPDAPKDFLRTDSAVTIKKLKELLPILVTCFQDFIPMVQSGVHLDAHSFNCIFSVVQCIDLIVKFFAHGTDNTNKELLVTALPHDGSDVASWYQNVLPSLLKKLWDAFPLNSIRNLPVKDEDRYFTLNIIITEIFLRLSVSNCPPMGLLENFLEFIESSLSKKISTFTQYGKMSRGRHLLSLMPYIPKLVLQLVGDWKSRLLQVFTELFKNCGPESSLKLACLCAVEHMLIPQHGYLNASDAELLEYQIIWIRELPHLLVQLGDKYPSSSKAALNLMLHLGQSCSLNLLLSQEYDNTQFLLAEFYGSCSDNGSICEPPFLRLGSDLQELSVCCLYYFSFLDPIILQSLLSSCLSSNLSPLFLSRILEILHSSYRAGRIQITHYISFLVTLVSRFKVFPENICAPSRKDEKTNDDVFRFLTSIVSSHLMQMGDTHLIFQVLEKVILDQISLKPPTDNICSLLRILVKLDSLPTRLSEQSISNLSGVLPGYLLDVASSTYLVQNIPEDDIKPSDSNSTRRKYYYVLPCFFLFQRSAKLLSRVLNVMRSLLAENGLTRLSYCSTPPFAIDRTSEIRAVVSVLLLLHKDIKVREALLSCKIEVDQITQNIFKLQSSESLTIEERHKIHCATDQLRSATSTLFDQLAVR